LPLWDRAFHDEILSRAFRYFARYVLLLLLFAFISPHIPILSLLNSFYGSVNEPAFLRDLDLAISNPDPSFRTANYSRLLHCAILAQGCCFSDDPRTADADSIVEAAILAIPEEGDRPMLSAVQGLLIISDFFTYTAKPSLGYLLGGIAFRLCHIRSFSLFLLLPLLLPRSLSMLTVGLQIDTTKHVEKGKLTEDLHRDRVRVFWAASFSDKYVLFLFFLLRC
jgi:hypothetical protein